MKAVIIAQNYIADRTKAIQGPSNRDASTLTLLQTGKEPYVIMSASGKSTKPGPCC